MNKEYISRLAEAELERKLKSSGCVLVNGPKFCGKSTMCERISKSTLSLKTSNVIKLVEADPQMALDGDRPRLIDEWQKVPELWNYIKDDLDRDYEFGKFIITGSTTPLDESKIQHSGAGRITTLVLRPFSLYESRESTGDVSLRELFNEDYKIKTVIQNSTHSLKDIAHMLCRGGWPIAIKADKDVAIDVTLNYYDGLFRIENESDDFAYLLKNKDVDLLILILKSYARNISSQAKKSNMIKGIVNSGQRSTLSEDTFNDYLAVLKKLFIVYELPAWNLNLRSTVAVRTAPTIHFYDTSIATSALGVTPDNLLNDLNSFGLFFEDFAVRDLSIYAQSFGATLKHYRDSSGQEVDAIVELRNGDFGAIEIKIASEKNINEGIASLLAFKRKMEGSKLKEPKFLMILTSHGACYKSKEGVYVVPIGNLKN